MTNFLGDEGSERGIEKDRIEEETDRVYNDVSWLINSERAEEIQKKIDSNPYEYDFS